MAPRASTTGGKKSTVVNGHSLAPNCHVFVSVPWSRREGEPYLIARVMEVLPAVAVSESTTGLGARVRVAYYLRPRDISNRYIADHRLVVATMHTDVIAAEYVRGLCTVKHKESIGDMDAYKRERDAFYWHQLYDRYLHRYFDAVPTDKIQNAPANVKKYLATNFEYILCEPGMSSELCEAERGCTTCFKWASNAESVTCDRCKSVWHLSCLDPPLAQKPKVGYSWSCAPCSKAHDEEVEAYMETGIAPVKKADLTAGKAKGKGKEKEKLDKGKGKEVVPGRVRLTNGWPFRYYGMHTEPYSVLDPHDSLYPRASTRLGNKFQAVVPAWDPDRTAEASESNGRAVSAKRSKASPPTSKAEKPKGKGARLPTPDRGEEDAARILFRDADDLTDEKLDSLVSSIKGLPAYKMAGVDLIDKGLSLVKNGDTSTALAGVRKATAGSVGHPAWNEADREKLVSGAAHFGNDIEEIWDTLPTKKIGDVVKRYYIDIAHALQEDVPQQIEEKEAAAAQVERKGKGSGRNKAAVDSDDEGSVCGPPSTAAAKRARKCAVCATQVAPRWYRCPEQIGTPTKTTDIHVMCQDCGLRWRHFGMQYPPTNPDDYKLIPAAPAKISGRKSEKVEPEPKRKDSLTKSRTTSPPPAKPVDLPPTPCLLCKKLEPKSTLAQCSVCDLSIHTGCYGVPEDIPGKDWRCDLCALAPRKKLLPAPRHCILCPPSTNIDEAAPPSALDILKPTEGKNYIHFLCSVWHPEIRFSETPNIIAEALPTIPSKRRLQTCAVCKVKDTGACIKCEDCTKHFHVGCAWSAGYRFGFEIHPLKKKRAKEVAPVKFKDEEGEMTACVWCPDHHFAHMDRITYEIAQRDPRTKLTALQTYISANKPGVSSDTFPLLRRARRLDLLISSALKTAVPGASIESGGEMLPPALIPAPRSVKRASPPVPVASERPSKQRRIESPEASVSLQPLDVDVDMSEVEEPPEPVEIQEPPILSSPSSLSAILNPTTVSITSLRDAPSFFSPSPPGPLLHANRPEPPRVAGTPPPEFASPRHSSFPFHSNLPPIPSPLVSNDAPPPPSSPIGAAAPPSMLFDDLPVAPEPAPQGSPGYDSVPELSDPVQDAIEPVEDTPVCRPGSSHEADEPLAQDAEAPTPPSESPVVTLDVPAPEEFTPDSPIDEILDSEPEAVDEPLSSHQVEAPPAHDAPASRWIGTPFAAPVSPAPALGGTTDGETFEELPEALDEPIGSQSTAEPLAPEAPEAPSTDAPVAALVETPPGGTDGDSSINQSFDSRSADEPTSSGQIEEPLAQDAPLPPSPDAPVAALVGAPSEGTDNDSSIKEPLDSLLADDEPASSRQIEEPLVQDAPSIDVPFAATVTPAPDTDEVPPVEEGLESADEPVSSQSIDEPLAQVQPSIDAAPVVPDSEGPMDDWPVEALLESPMVDERLESDQAEVAPAQGASQGAPRSSSPVPAPAPAPLPFRLAQGGTNSGSLDAPSEGQQAEELLDDHQLEDALVPDVQQSLPTADPTPEVVIPAPVAAIVPVAPVAVAPAPVVQRMQRPRLYFKNHGSHRPLRVVEKGIGLSRGANKRVAPQASGSFHFIDETVARMKKHKLSAATASSTTAAAAPPSRSASSALAPTASSQPPAIYSLPTPQGPSSYPSPNDHLASGYSPYNGAPFQSTSRLAANGNGPGTSPRHAGSTGPPTPMNEYADLSPVLSSPRPLSPFPLDPALNAFTLDPALNPFTLDPTLGGAYPLDPSLLFGANPWMGSEGVPAGHSG
ncbi:hypothetical protein RQP46_006983 [Phenoliferia psychrophenolica]